MISLCSFPDTHYGTKTPARFVPRDRKTDCNVSGAIAEDGIYSLGFTVSIDSSKDFFRVGLMLFFGAVQELRHPSSKNGKRVHVCAEGAFAAI